jgi:hypothetical protein
MQGGLVAVAVVVAVVVAVAFTGAGLLASLEARQVVEWRVSETSGSFVPFSICSEMHDRLICGS